jgi:hypothetical protein
VGEGMYFNNNNTQHGLDIQYDTRETTLRCIDKLDSYNLYVVRGQCVDASAPPCGHYRFQYYY